jgi:hypothetical protein
MTSTNRTTIPARLSQSLAAAALIAGLAIGAAATASAERTWDIGVYDACWNSGLGRGYSQAEFDQHVQGCCIKSGGDWDSSKELCVAPAPLQSPPGTVAPPIQQTPVQQIEPGQTGSPSTVMTVPRGPAIGRLP